MEKLIKLAEEKGFKSIFLSHKPYKYSNKEELRQLFLLVEIQKWLREVWKTSVTSDPITGFSKCDYSWNIYTFRNIWTLTCFTAIRFNNYEEALKAGIMKALEMID